MGKAGRWLRGLLSGKKVEEAGRAAESRSYKEKKKWEFIKSFREKEKGRPQKEQPQPRAAAVAVAEAVSEQRKWSYRETREAYVRCSPARSGSLADGDEQNKHAIAVAAATAAVAEAAVAAAQAAAAVVRLTSSGKSGGFCTAGVKLEEWAAVKVQAAFRGYLARRALRALKGLVKLQALVRGNIVRKKAAETLRCMQALVRVQARARACRALGSETSRSSKSSRSNPSPPTPEKYESSILRCANNSYHSGSLKRTSSKKTQMDAANKDSGHSGNWNWLDQWMEERYWDTRQVSKAMDDEKYTKILEVDTCKPPQFNSRRRTNHLQYACSPMNSNENSRNLAFVPDSSSKDSTTARLSVPSPSSFDDRHESPSPLRFPIVVEPGNMGESPQFFSAASRPGSSRRSPFTPAKSECSRSLFSGYTDYPNYMAYTESSRAKVRSQSAPKQRPECEKSSWIKRPTAHGFGGQQAATSLRYSFVNKEYPGSGRLDRLGMPMKV